MVSPLTIDRVRSDVGVLARAGVETGEFLDELDAAVERVVPHVSMCSSTTDPATLMITATYKFGDLASTVGGHDHEWGLLEYMYPEPSSIPLLAGRSEACVTMFNETGGDLVRSRRMREIVVPTFAYGDELRLAARSNGRFWGGLSIYRGSGERPFSTSEVAFMESLSELLAIGFRSGTLARLANREFREFDGPAVIIVDDKNTVSRMTPNAQELLTLIRCEPHRVSGDGMLAGLIAAARASNLPAAPLPRCRVRLRTGHWLVLHASRLSGPAAATGEVVITIEEARPPEIVPFVVAAFDLTDRERDVIQLVLQSVETKHIASTLHMSPYTVQDHLKSIFDKADVRSRRELIARVFFDQYVPRMGSDLAPSGWFASA